MSLLDTLDDAIRASLARWHVPGAAVGVLRDGAVETRGYGVASLETQQPALGATLFQIGSISKVFTATLVLRLVEDGMLSLDTPVVTYLPELRLADAQAQASITLRHLLSHSSGLFGDYFADFGMGDDALTQAVAHFSELRQYTPPGELWAYCNSGFNLAGRVVERVLGTTFEAAMRERVFAPLGLERAFFFAHEAIVYPHAVGHTQVTPGDDAHEVARLYPLPRCVGPAGGIIASVADLLTFAAFHIGDTSYRGTSLLTHASRAAMQTPHVRAANFADAYGLGWALRDVAGVQVVEHGGSTNGFQARLLTVPTQGFALAVLTNSSRGSAFYKEVSEQALAVCCRLRANAPTPIALENAALAFFAGRYSTPESAITLAVHDGGLRYDATNTDTLTGKVEVQPSLQLQPIGEREFLVTTPGDTQGVRIDFVTGGGDRPRFLRTGGRLADPLS